MSEYALPTPICTRKDIAKLLNVTPRMVRDNEHAWGLSKLRVDLNPKEVRYCTQRVISIMVSRGWIQARN